MENNYMMCKACGQILAETDRFCPNCGAMTENMPVACKSCGAELSATDKFCPNCGAQRNADQVKPIFKKWWFWVIILVVALVIGVVIGISGDTSEPVVTAPIATEAPVEAPAVEAPAVEAPAAEAPAADDGSISKAKKVDTLIAMLEMSIPENFDYYTIEGDETGVTVSVASDGIAEGVVSAKKVGLDDSFAPWVEARDAMVNLCNTISEAAETIGLYDFPVTLTVLNDLNYDNVLLVIMNGYVIYDIMAE